MIAGLDGLRAIAFLLVFLFHTNYLEFGWVGVQLFFVLSGFLITGILLDMKASLPKAEFLKKFYGRRAVRIFPLYYFYLAAMSLLAAWLISIDYRPSWMELFTKQVKYAVFYIYNFHAATIFNEPNHFLSHLWSLAVEEQFYIVWPILILLTPEKWRKAIFISFIALGPILRLGLLLLYNTGEIRMFVNSPGEVIYALPISHIDAFAFGAYISRYPVTKIKQKLLFILLATPVLGFATQYIAGGDVARLSTLGYPFHMPEHFQYIWGYTVINCLSALTIYAVVQYRIFIRVLEWKPLKWLGKISYGLYIYHLPILWFALDIGDLGVKETWVKPLAAFIGFAGTVLISSASYYFLEKPFLKLKDRYFPLALSDEKSALTSQASITRPAELEHIKR